MNIERTIAMARKETRQVIRDRIALYLALGIPAMLMILYGYALSLDVDNIPLGVWDQDNSQQSRELLSRLTSSGYFRTGFKTDSYVRLVKAIDRNQINIGLIIPYDFSRNLKHGRTSNIQALVDGSDSTRAGIAMGYIESIVAMFEDDFSRTALTKQSIEDRIVPPLDARIRLMYNPELISRNNIIPGLIAIIMMVIAALLTSLTIVRERETGTLEQLISTPIKPIELIAGKLIPYYALAYVDLVMVYLMGRYVFQVPFRGSVFLMFFASSLFLVGAMSLGFLISVVARNQFFATQLALLGTFLPSFILSGFVFPIGNMPELLQAVTHVVPARHLVIILRGIYLKGAGVEILAMPIAFLALFGFIVAFAAIKRLGKRIT